MKKTTRLCIMSKAAAGLVIIACGLAGGCFGSGYGPQQYQYAIDLRNDTSRTLNVELLRIDSSNIRKTRIDLAPGASLSDRFSTGNTEYVEARITQAGFDLAGPRELVELPRGVADFSLIERDGRIVAMKQPSEMP